MNERPSSSMHEGMLINYGSKLLGKEFIERLLRLSRDLPDFVYQGHVIDNLVFFDRLLRCISYHDLIENFNVDLRHITGKGHFTQKHAQVPLHQWLKQQSVQDVIRQIDQKDNIRFTLLRGLNVGINGHDKLKSTDITLTNYARRVCIDSGLYFYQACQRREADSVVRDNFTGIVQPYEFPMILALADCNDVSGDHGIVGGHIYRLSSNVERSILSKIGLGTQLSSLLPDHLSLDYVAPIQTAHTKFVDQRKLVQWIQTQAKRIPRK